MNMDDVQVEKSVLYSEKKLKNTEIMVDDTSKGFLVPSKANRTLAQALDCFQGDFAAPRLGAQDNHNNIDGQIQG